MYRKVSVESASPARILDELYARALLEIDDGAECLARRDLAGKGRAFTCALAIIDELRCSLDAAIAPEICLNLERLYLFARERIVAASINLDGAPLDEARAVLVTLREAFAAAARAAR